MPTTHTIAIIFALLFATGSALGYAPHPSAIPTNPLRASAPLREKGIPTTPAITNTIDRLGRRTSIATTNDAIVLFVNEVNQVTNETHTAGLLAGYSLSTTFDPLQRRSSLSLTQSGTDISPVTFYSYDSASRLQVVSNASENAATYSYLPGVDQVTGIVFTASGATRLTTAKTFDTLYRLTAITNLPSAASAISAGYTYNQANQRTRADLSDTSDTSYWSYSYDSLGQVTNGIRRWSSDDSIVAGQNYAYLFNDIGNRVSTTYNANSPSLYSANLLNQYTQRTIPGVVEISGSATTNATITINNQPTERHNEYFYGSINAANTSTAVWTNINVVGVLKNAGTSQTDIVTQSAGHKFLAQTPETFTYDPDGNLTSDGRWTYTWDAENRLLSAESLTNAPVASKRKVEWTYDAQGRRIQQTVYNGSSGAYVTTNNKKMLYDGWQLISEIETANSLTSTNSYTWGLDLSGTTTRGMSRRLLKLGVVSG